MKSASVRISRLVPGWQLPMECRQGMFQPLQLTASVARNNGNKMEFPIKKCNKIKKCTVYCRCFTRVCKQKGLGSIAEAPRPCCRAGEGLARKRSEKALACCTGRNGQVAGFSMQIACQDLCFAKKAECRSADRHHAFSNMGHVRCR